MNMTQKMFVATLTTATDTKRGRKHEAYFETDADAHKWVRESIHNDTYGRVTKFVIDNRDVHINEFIWKKVKLTVYITI